MPLEVRVSDDTITEIYRAEDFFGGHGASRDGAGREEADVCEEMKANVVNRRRRGGRPTRKLRNWIFP